ncbi:MAG TPA: hypothetical protein VGP62_29580, partial [Bryobacteraceae bacterium]|nr:hypothetical protein [Bryobacteraceae bacterium]
AEMSNGRSLWGTSLAAETSAQPPLCFQGLAPRFLESLGAARKSACATGRLHGLWWASPLKTPSGWRN